MSFFDGFLYPNAAPATTKPVKVFSKNEVALERLNLLIALKSSIEDSAHVGSSFINGKGVDLDLVVKVKDAQHAQDLLMDAGYILSSTGSGSGDKFCCFRKGDVNVMITESQDWYELFVKAALVCRAVTLQGIQLSKEGRIAVHRVLMDGESPEEATKKAQEVSHK